MLRDTERGPRSVDVNPNMKVPGFQHKHQLAPPTNCTCMMSYGSNGNRTLHQAVEIHLFSQRWFSVVLHRVNDLNFINPLARRWARISVRRSCHKTRQLTNLIQMIWNILDWMMTSERLGLISLNRQGSRVSFQNHLKGNLGVRGWFLGAHKERLVSCSGL